MKNKWILPVLTAILLLSGCGGTTSDFENVPEVTIEEQPEEEKIPDSSEMPSDMAENLKQKQTGHPVCFELQPVLNAATLTKGAFI